MTPEVERIAAAMTRCASSPRWPHARNLLESSLELAGFPVDGRPAPPVGMHAELCEARATEAEAAIRERPIEAVRFLSAYLDEVREQLAQGPWGSYERKYWRYYAHRPWRFASHVAYEVRRLWYLLTALRRVPEAVAADAEEIVGLVANRMFFEKYRREEIAKQTAKEKEQDEDRRRLVVIR